CSTRDGYVYAAGERLGYGELAATAARQWVPIRPRLKHQDAFSLIGQSPARLDIPAKVAGSTRYGADVTLPGMLHAVVLRPPVAGQAGVIRDEAACRAVPGVRDVFAIDEGIAVVAAGTFAALEGRARLDVEWAAPTSAPVNGQSLQAALEAALAGSGRVVAGSGEAVDQPSHSASYFAPFLAHACMEPMNCTVSIANGGCQIWVGTQDPHGARAVAAQAAGMDPGAVVVHVLPLGGGFGRRAGQDFVREAVQIARRMKAPVQLLWTREDDLGHGRYREAVGVRTSARVDGAGRPRQVEHFVASAVPHASVVDPGIGPLMGADSPIYAFDSATVRWAGVPVPIPTTIWRSVGYSYNTFAIECFIDELAARAGADPLTFRLGLLPDGSPVARCIEQVAALCRWTEADGRFLGMSAYQFAQTSVAMVAAVAPDDGTSWRVSDVWCAVDCGTVVHLDSATAQIESGVMFGLSAALFEQVTIAQGAVSSRNFHTYRLARFEDAPDIHVALLPGTRPPAGLGEAGTPGIAPAVANALYRLTGERVRALPLRS
ncbi:MAG TPA: molybdopterin cofactor-binding domain-containing protein, partial [Pseudomonadales bacterium]